MCKAEKPEHLELRPPNKRRREERGHRDIDIITIFVTSWEKKLKSALQKYESKFSALFHCMVVGKYFGFEMECGWNWCYKLLRLSGPWWFLIYPSGHTKPNYFPFCKASPDELSRQSVRLSVIVWFSIIDIQTNYCMWALTQRSFKHLLESL